jgi:hypothetical protein
VEGLKMEGYYVIRTYEAGPIGEKIKFPVLGEKPPKSERKLKSDIKKVKQNAADATRKLARLINENFRSGYLIGLDYSPAGYTKLEHRAAAIKDEDIEEPDRMRQAAIHELRNLIRRVQWQADKAGIEVKYIAITSDMDGETGEAVRIHHHLIINSEALPLFQQKWTAGSIEYEKLSGQPDYTPIAVYFMNQVRKIPDEKKYTPSRNLKYPEPKDRIAKSGAEIRPPRGAVLLQRSEYRPGLPQYIRYIIPQDTRKKSPGSKEGVISEDG